MRNFVCKVMQNRTNYLINLIINKSILIQINPSLLRKSLSIKGDAYQFFLIIMSLNLLVYNN